MECRDVNNKIWSLMDDELSEGDARVVREHLRQCRTCAMEYRDLALAWELVAAIPRMEPSAALWPVIQARMRHAPATRLPQLRRWVFPALAATVFAGGIAIGVFLGGWMQAGRAEPRARAGETRNPVQNFQSIRHFADAPPGSLAEGILVSSTSSGKRGNEP